MFIYPFFATEATGSETHPANVVPLGKNDFGSGLAHYLSSSTLW